MQEHTGSGGGPIETRDVSDIEFARRFLWMVRKAQQQKEKNSVDESQE